jgi:N-acetyl-beta-hexosaminidase
MQGEFELTGNSRIVVIADNHYNEVKRNVAEYLVDIIRASTGFGIAVADDQENPADGDIVFTLASLDGASSESYNLKVETNRITITANEPEGLFRAVQTLRQLFGPDIERKSVTPGKKWSVACASITDSPAYPYRGLMLDVARHFFPKEEVMRQIDLAAQYKINKLHLHLTDDQGWRIEIKSRPALTEIGSLGAINGDKGGYYTQDDFKAIVEYAAKRYIEVIPEIDMPGHTNAALVSIPELNPDGKAAKPRTDFAVGYSTLQCRSEITYQFIDDVIKELAEISPSPYIHIGGDEADSTSASDYNYFIERVSEIVKKYGKTTVGWTPYERSNGTLEDAVIQNWFCTQASFNISRQKNMGSILSPAAAYLDQKYNPGTRLGQDWRGHISLKTSYNWYPAKLAPKNVLLGIESALWSETLVTGDDIDFMLYPRLIANAEVGWTAEDSRKFAEFMSRLPRQLLRLDALGVKYSTKYN